MKEKTVIIISGVILLLAMAVFVFTLTRIGKNIIVSQTPEGEISTINVNGSAKLEVAPDEAEIKIRIETKEKTPKEAQDANSKAMTNVQAALKQAGIDEKNIESVRYNVYQIKEWNPKTGHQEERGFAAEHVIKVTTNDLEKVGSFIEVAVNAGANNIEDVNFVLSKKLQKEVKEKALIQACENASEKAKAIAIGLDVIVGHPLSISETSFEWGPINRPYGMAEMKVAEGGAGAPPPVNPEQVTVQAQIAVSYRIK